MSGKSRSVAILAALCLIGLAGPAMAVPPDGFQITVPEIDAGSATGAIALLLGALFLAGERRRRRSA
jgi:hypothetical protein